MLGFYLFPLIDPSLGLDLARFPFFLLRYEVSLGAQSLDPVLRVAAWSLNAIRLEYIAAPWLLPMGE